MVEQPAPQQRYGQGWTRGAVSRPADDAVAALRTGRPLTAQEKAALAAVLAPAVRASVRALGPALSTAGATARRLAAQVQTAIASAARAAEPVLLLLAQLQTEKLPNWPSALSYAQLRPLLDQEGLPVAWVPRAELLERWIQAPDADARRALLVQHRVEVVEDCRQALSEVVAPDLQDARLLLSQAVNCVLTYPAPAQSLALQAAAVLAADALGTGPRLHKLRESLVLLEQSSGLPPFGQLRAHLTLLAVRPILTRFNVELDGVPVQPNRHAVAHSLDRRQYSETNGLQSVLLAASVLRQAQADRDIAAAGGAWGTVRRPAAS